MARCQVTCITKRGDHFNPHERISHIGNQAGSWKLTEESAIQRIEVQQDSFYTLVSGRETEVIVASHNCGFRWKWSSDSIGSGPGFRLKWSRIPLGSGPHFAR